ncbi:MAG: GNAT family N-acetyltransferase [Saonia sp.]
MEEITIRPASLEDLEVLLEFEQGIITAERPFDPTLKEDPIHYYDLKQMILSDKAEVVVAVCNSVVVSSGYAIIKKAKSYLDHTEYAYLGFMYTHPEFRGKGINKMIVDALKKWSIDQGLNEIRLTVYPDNAPAIRAYEKIGFKKYILEMRMDRDELS